MKETSRDGTTAGAPAAMAGRAAMTSTLSPQRVESNRVPTFYKGGENIDRFRGKRAERQGPEDWVGSMTSMNESTLAPGVPRDSGISPLSDGTLLRAAVEADPESWLGAALLKRWNGSSALLVKLLDSGVRLPVHYHPSRSFAQQHLDSPFGKTEAWIIMDDAPGGEVWLGFREAVSEARFSKWIEAQAADEMLDAMNRLPAQPGDVFYVPAGVPHAIGPGVMLTELQEPTDFSIMAEHDVFGLADDKATLHLGWPLAVTAADLSAYDASRLDVLRPPPTVLADDADGRVVQLFADHASEFFQAHRIELQGRRTLAASFQVLVVESGHAALESDAGEVTIKAGETWVVPFSAGPAHLSGAARIIACLPGEA